MYNLETEKVAREILKHNASKVLVQIPDGLRTTAFSLAEELRLLTGAEILLSGDSCYGACDIALAQAEAVQADMLVHYGHSEMIKADIPVLYVEATYDFKAECLIQKALPLISGWDGVGLATTVQHTHKMEEITRILENNGVKPAVGRGAPFHHGQILGCDYTTATSIVDKVKGYLFVGAGRFHPLGLAASTGKPVVVADPYTMEVWMLKKRWVTRLAMKRMAAINAAREVKRIAVLLSTKPGQRQTDIAKDLKEKVRKSGRESVTIVLDEITTLKLGNFTEPQAFIVTACPRIAIDGLPDEARPLLTTIEAKIMLGEKSWEEVWGRGYIS
ncbi:MAG: diphthamide biosynthesis enzyme Dph2 [Candidatus Bathyarchaeota archaeon]|jgi:2-(3-amino-3-carboxypropyl)histidine synthase